MKQLACGSLMPGCNAVLEGKDDAEVMQRAAAHAQKEHGMASIPDETVKRAKALIKEV